MKLKNNQQGQTLLELVIASGIVVAVLVSILGAMIINYRAKIEAEGRFLAGQLAREGVELVRNIRDSNWLDLGKEWSSGLIGGDNDGIVDFNPLTGELSVDFTVNQIEQARLYQHYGYINHDSPGGEALNYYRLIILNGICISDFPPTEFCPPSSPELIGLKVTSEVAWEIKGGMKYFQVDDYLYNWK